MTTTTTYSTTETKAAAPRLNYAKAAPAAFKAMLALQATVEASGLDATLLNLVKLRASQINGCAFCIDMHWADLLKQGMEPRHVNAVAGWREAARFFSEAERAALNWAEAVNAVPQRTPSDADFDAVKRHFSDAQIADLTFAVGAIRSWNMLNASFHMPVPETPFTVD